MLAGLTAVIVIAIFQETHAVSDTFCPNDWFSYENYCYRNYTTKVEYWEARRRCQALGADLTTMVNANETEALAWSFPSIPGKVDLLIGLYRQTRVVVGGSADGFRWTDGTPYNSTYDNWFDPGTGSKEPNYGDQYGRFYRRDGTSPVKWGASGEGVKKGYICKKEVWDLRKQHCLNGNCYRMSTQKFNSSTAAQRECQVHQMTVLHYGNFPGPLNSIFSMQDMPDDHFWQDYENRTQCCSLSSAEECPANTAARVMCVGPAELTCPCGWIGFDDNCYYLGAESDNTGSKWNATQICNKINASLTEITSHMENLFIRSIARGSHSYWIKNDKNSMYCGRNNLTCWDQTIITGNGEWQQSSSSHSIMCKKKKTALRTPNFCIDSYPGECYSFFQTPLSFANLKLTNCGANQKILKEEMLRERIYLSPFLINAINLHRVTCPAYWIDSKDPLLISKDGITKVSRQNATSFAGYICVTDIDECASSPCVNGGTCVDALHDFRCLCESGYSGKKCEIEIDECASSPCLNNGTCVDEVDDFGCVCAAGYYGKQCEQVSVSLNVGIISSLAALLGIAVIVIFIVVCRQRMRQTPSDGIHGNSAQDEHTYYDITSGLGSGNPPMEHAREERKGASAGKGIQLKAANKKTVESDEAVKACKNVEENDGYLAPRAFPPNFAESAEYEDVEMFGQEKENAYLEVIG